MKTSKSGFALVIALSLMAFVLLLLLSIVTFIQVETTTANITKEQLKARMNAQLGGMIALGNLQKLAGPDQRVTARSDVVLAPGDSGLDGQVHWTGVWSSLENEGDLNDVAAGLASRQAQWLVSGASRDFTPDAHQQIPGSVETVQLASVGRSVPEVAEGGVEDFVVAPLVSINGADAGRLERGHYAYWVSDEGVKARVNLSDPHRDGGTELEHYYSAAMAQQGDPTAATVQQGEGNYERPYALSGGISLWKDGDHSFDRVATVSTLPLAVDGVDDVEGLQREFFHDLSVHSESVIADTKNGGLKRDLSSALRNLPEDLENSLIFASASGEIGLDGGSPGDPGGAKWTQLADHYLQSLVNSNKDSSDPITVRQPTNDQVGIAPVITRVNFIIQGVAVRTGADANEATDYEYMVGFFPLVTLWNPYDRDLVMPDLGFYTSLRNFMLVHDSNPNTNIGSYEWETDGSRMIDIIRVWDPALTKDDADSGRRFVGFTLAGTTIPAGGAVNFTPPNNSYIDYEDGSQNVLKPGATGTLVRGFFGHKRIVAQSKGPLEMFDGSGYCRMRISTGINGWFDYCMNLLQMVPGSDAIAERLACSTMVGYGRTWDVLPRVVAMDEMGPLTVDAVGSSISESAEGETSFDLDILQQLTLNSSSSQYEGAYLGAARSMVFPRNDILSGNRRVHLFSQMNPRSPLSILSPNALSNGNQFNYQMYDTGFFTPIDPQRYLNYSKGTETAVGYVGLRSDSSTGGSENMVLFEAPSRPPLGIGSLMHANLLNIERIANQVEQGKWRSNYQLVHTTPAYAIGNSFANIHLPLNETKLSIHDNNFFGGGSGVPSFTGGANGAAEGTQYDYSYELNEALWDRFFFSTILPDDPSGAPQLDPSSVEFPLPNGRMKPWNTSFEVDDLVDERRAAANLVLEGGFNINSTSVAAWESILGALRDVETLSGDSSSGEARHNYARVVAPLLDSTDEIPSYESASGRDAISAGFRSLTDDQISSLAMKLVDEIRTRRTAYGYPFLSLADFVNRSIAADDLGDSQRRRFAYCGPLQYAIDQSTVNGRPALDGNWNGQSGDGMWSQDYVTPDLDSSVSPYHPESLEVIRSRPYMEGAAGSLTQADVLSKLGSIIMPRSDTFTIRSYGSSNSLQSDSKAYLEMVVQRTPNYLDSSDEAYNGATAPLNQTFGRRFVVVSSRWLNSEDI